LRKNPPSGADIGVILSEANQPLPPDPTSPPGPLSEGEGETTGGGRGWGAGCVTPTMFESELV